MEERITKRHVNDKPFMAYNCEDDERVATAEYSLNPPKPCDRADWSAYFPPTPSKGQILQEVRRLPVKTSICKVDWRVTTGWCGGEYVAMNYMHASIQTMRAFILPSYIQCHNALSDQSLELTVPSYGSIEEMSLKIKLSGGVAYYIKAHPKSNIAGLIF